MNENELRTYCLEHAGETLPAEAEALLSRDPQLKQQVDQLIFVSKLVSLKRHEQPDAASVHRCLQSVNARIEENRRGGWFVRLRDWLDVETSAPQLAYAAAALAVCAVGVGLLLRGNSPDAVTVAAQETPAVVRPVAVPEPVEMRVEAVAPAAVEQIAETEKYVYPNFDKPLIVLQVNSNPQPSSPRMQIGSGATVPVSFDY